MYQLTQELKSGTMKLMNVNSPALSKGKLLIKNYFSIISAGTEGKTVSDARKGYIAKAKSRQKEVKQVINLAASQGVVNTYKVVKNKLEAPSPLGYSCAGEVIGVGEGINDIKVGDFVACGGAGAFHAEVVSVYRNLCVKIPDGVDVKYSAFTTIAAIALQGIRQADLRLGENAVIIGLGLIGQLTIQMLNTAGVNTYGIDIDAYAVKLASECGATLAIERKRKDLIEQIYTQTNGHGTDAVIITAGTSSNDPVDLAGELCRRKGKVIIVGAVPTGFSRPNYYKKELDLRMSSSYGPGRYDPQYEEKGIDYPYGYIRWTENRNMQAYIDLLKNNKLNIEKLISHEFNFEDVSDAYQMIVEKKGPFTGVVLKYNIENPVTNNPVYLNENYKSSPVNIGFIGAGSFAQNFLLPNAKRLAALIGVATAGGHTSKYIAEKYGFNYATTSADEIIMDEKIDTVFVATRHNLHAEYVIKTLKAGKNVFVEKPLAMNSEELNDIQNIYSVMLKKKNVNTPRLMVGYNRRFSPHIIKVKSTFSNDLPKAINYRINAGKIPKEHWVQDPEIGGGRIVGEVCHFVDLCIFLASSSIKSLVAYSQDNKENLNDTLTISLQFFNGSIATISYFSNGNSNLPKEQIEIFSAGQVAVIDDFKELTIYSEKRIKDKSKQDKGHASGIETFIKTIINGQPSPISFDELLHSADATLKIIESIKSGKVINFKNIT